MLARCWVHRNRQHLLRAPRLCQTPTPTLRRTGWAWKLHQRLVRRLLAHRKQELMQGRQSLACWWHQRQGPKQRRQSLGLQGRLPSQTQALMLHQMLVQQVHQTLGWMLHRRQALKWLQNLGWRLPQMQAQPWRQTPALMRLHTLVLVYQTLKCWQLQMLA